MTCPALAVLLINLATAPPPVLQAPGTRANLHAVRELRKRLLGPAQPDATWSHFDPARLTLMVDLAGPEMAGAYRYGHLRVQARDNLGGELKLVPPGGADSNPTDSFVDIDWAVMFAWEQDRPANRLRIELGFAPPPRNATHLALVEGSVLVQRAGTQEQLTFDRILERNDEVLRHPLLEKARLSVQVGVDTDQTVSLLVTGPLEVLSDIQLIGSQGQLLGTGRVWTTQGERSTLALQAWETPPAGTALRLTVAGDQQTVVVPFKFGNIALP